MSDVVRLSATDNVLVALRALAGGSVVDGLSVRRTCAACWAATWAP